MNGPYSVVLRHNPHASMPWQIDVIRDGEVAQVSSSLLPGLSVPMQEWFKSERRARRKYAKMRADVDRRNAEEAHGWPVVETHP